MASSTLNIKKILRCKKTQGIFMLPHTVSLRELVKKAYEKGVGAVLITGDDSKCVGIITERDIMRCCAKGLDFDHVTAREVMCDKLIVVKMDDDINHAMDVMIKSNIRHLPVVSDKGLEGIVTIRDLIQAIRQSDQEEIEEFVKYLQSHLTHHKAADKSCS